MGAFFVVLDDRSHFFNDNIKIIMFIKDVKAITLKNYDSCFRAFYNKESKHFVFCLVVVNKIRKIV